jgi:5'-phosphate synthase pdxT subunit
MLEGCADASSPLQVLEVRAAPDLDGLGGLLLPGGESTTMSRLCDRYELWEPLGAAVEAGLPLLGTCAGMIMMAKEVSGATRNFAQRTLGALDVDVARNAYGRQLDSFETDLEVPEFKAHGLGEEPLRAVFIRAPRLERLGPDVEVVARHKGEPVAVAQGQHLACAFHPEIADDDRLHRLWLRRIQELETQRSEQIEAVRS